MASASNKALNPFTTPPLQPISVRKGRGRPRKYNRDEKNKPIIPPGTVKENYTRREVGGRQPSQAQHATTPARSTRFSMFTPVDCVEPKHNMYKRRREITDFVFEPESEVEQLDVARKRRVQRQREQAIITSDEEESENEDENKDNEEEKRCVSSEQSTERRRISDNEASIGLDNEVVQSIERPRSMRYGLRATVMTEEEEMYYPIPPVNPIEPLLRGPDYKRFREVVGEARWRKFCTQMSYDPKTGDPWTDSRSPTLEQEDTRSATVESNDSRSPTLRPEMEESPFNSPPVEHRGSYETLEEADYGGFVTNQLFAFNKTGPVMDRTDFTTERRTMDLSPTRRKVESRPFLSGTFTSSLATDKDTAEEREDELSGREGTIIDLTDSDLDIEGDASEHSDSTDIEDWAPPKRSQRTVDTPLNTPLLLKDTPMPRPSEKTDRSHAVRHSKKTGEPWPDNTKSIALAAETALKSRTIFLETLDENSIKPGSDMSWAIWYSKMGKGKAPPTGSKWSTHPDDVKEAARLMREIKPQFTAWVEKEWWPVERERRAEKNVARMLDEAWGVRRPDYQQEVRREVFETFFGQY